MHGLQGMIVCMGLINPPLNGLNEFYEVEATSSLQCVASNGIMTYNESIKSPFVQTMGSESHFRCQ